MRKRIGWILVISGAVLLLKPSFDVDMIMFGVHYIITNYWPAGIVFIGILLVWPQKRSASKRKKS